MTHMIDDEIIDYLMLSSGSLWIQIQQVSLRLTQLPHIDL